MPMLLRHAPVALACAVLGGCAVGPDYRPSAPETLRIPEGFTQASPAPGSAQAAEAEQMRWWPAFESPELSQLVERGLAANLDVEQAGARVRQARAALRSARGGLLPSLSVGASASRRNGSDASAVTTTGDATLYDAGFDAAYELDLFGGVRRSVEAARADSDAALAQLRSTQLTIAAEIALNYLDARAAQERLRLARDNLAALDETLEIVGFRVQAGLVGSLDQEQARQLRAQTAASLPALEQAGALAAHRLAVLLAEPPGAAATLLAPTGPLPLAPGPAAAPIPAEVIRRRPDVAVAERSLAAEVARIGLRQADLYPALRLSGSFGGSATSVSQIRDAAFSTLAASLSAPLFQGGQLRAAVEGQRAAADAALYGYRQAVLLALEDVENALLALSSAERRRSELDIAATAAQNAVALARTQYRAGLIDFQSLLESERAVLSSEDSRVTARADQAAATVQLYKALGGGWQVAPQPASMTRSATTRP
ncbi:MAG: efflux transporter outer membrane subunit [Gammaproteobacteria bacterium]|nr:efflux transporter outer membrane subunit [Gammaproteobacteria bacterium]